MSFINSVMLSKMFEEFVILTNSNHEFQHLPRMKETDKVLPHYLRSTLHLVPTVLAIWCNHIKVRKAADTRKSNQFSCWLLRRRVFRHFPATTCGWSRSLSGLGCPTNTTNIHIIVQCHKVCHPRELGLLTKLSQNRATGSVANGRPC